jgi:pimeloyl-ACP methyl ester carboxylesterase
MSMYQKKIVAVPMPVAPGRPDLTGPQRYYPYLDMAMVHRTENTPETALLFCHPAGNFLNHYLMEPLARRGVAACGLNTRYAGNDSGLIMEEAALDVGAAVRGLRARFRHVVLVGNSGGGSLMAFYQSQAERPTVRETPAGDPVDLTAADLPRGDAFIALAAHPGRATVLTDGLDPAVVDELDPGKSDNSLDMFDSRNGPPYDPDWLAEYRCAQRARNDRITEWAIAALDELRGQGLRDRAFVTYRTGADPRWTDLSIDPSDRDKGSLHGDPCMVNFAVAGGLGRYSGLRSWLSQWSLARTNADGVRAIARVSVPVLVVSFTADQGAFPSYAEAYLVAVPHGDKELRSIAGATHYLYRQPSQTEETADAIADWLQRKGFLDEV